MLSTLKIAAGIGSPFRSNIAACMHRCRVRCRCNPDPPWRGHLIGVAMHWWVLHCCSLPAIQCLLFTGVPCPPFSRAGVYCTRVHLLKNFWTQWWWSWREWSLRRYKRLSERWHCLIIERWHCLIIVRQRQNFVGRVSCTLPVLV